MEFLIERSFNFGHSSLFYESSVLCSHNLAVTLRARMKGPPTDLLFSLFLRPSANLEFNSAHDVEIFGARVYYTVIYTSCQYLIRGA